MAVKNKVQLITYPDSLGGNLKALNRILQKYFVDIFEGGIHILPPFPSSGDRGFAPLTYLEIEPAFGSWDDIRAIGEHFDVLLDLMVNHISKESVYFQDFLKNGRDSQFADLFITLDKIWSNGKPVQEDVDKMFLRRTQPYSMFHVGASGEQMQVWTTFGKQVPSEQIDLDINSALTRQLLTDFMLNFSKQNIKIVRLDAVGYVIKKLGTSCFFVEPEIHQFMEWITNLAHSLNIELLPEVHSHYSIQYKLAEKGHWIYDFILPYFVLETLINKSGKRLCEYLRVRPHKQFTMLDCHDGIPVKPDLDDLVSSADARKVVDVCLERGSNLSLIFSDKHKSEDGFDVHQIRCSFYSVLGCNDDAYIAARAIQFFTPGIPQVYYVGMLAGENDAENVLKTGEGREINRHNFSIDEIDQAVNKPVVQRLMKLIRFRNHYPAFNGIFQVGETQDDMIALSWEKDRSRCVLSINLNTYSTQINYLDETGQTVDFYA
ncbi:sucrose phosphorylase [Paludibacter sp.]|uniref:sucrose phosphorylase n=1 Tax=Paludibacter sp. TaxID=1898105 RepID=UPI001355EEEC|nr:sucrose phosphorylase [Paludibacter sp.]MTK52981.1 sucrose phosphorylase [Paludibacter sp.]